MDDWEPVVAEILVTVEVSVEEEQAIVGAFRSRR